MAPIRLEEENHRLSERCGNLEKALEASTAINKQMLKLCQENGIDINGQMLEEIQKLNHDQEKALMAAKIELLERRVCENDCVLGVIASICESMFKGVTFCYRQLEKIMILSPGPKIEQEDFNCAHFMKILETRNIVAQYAEYKFDRCDEIKAWDELMTMAAFHGVVIIGIVKSGTNSVGHVELCYLDTRTIDPRAADGRVLKIHDPQREMSEKGRVVDLQHFTEHIKKEGAVGVIFYIVNFVELKDIIIENALNLHVTTEGVRQSVN